MAKERDGVQGGLDLEGGDMEKEPMEVTQATVILLVNLQEIQQLLLPQTYPSQSPLQSAFLLQNLQL